MLILPIYSVFMETGIVPDSLQVLRITVSKRKTTDEWRQGVLDPRVRLTQMESF